MQNFICLKYSFAFFFLFFKGVLEMKYMIVTGASSGIGEAMCYSLAKRGYSLIIVARREEQLKQLKEKITQHYAVEVEVMPFDLSQMKQVMALYDACQQYSILGIINNAGYGVFGEFVELPLEEELNMLDLNIKSLHTLSKLFLKDFITQDEGYLMNVASTAAFQSGPLMAGYYASKGYVLQLTEAIAYEVKAKTSNVTVSVLCPGPVETNFQKRARIHVASGNIPTAEEVAELAIEGMLNGKEMIVPGRMNRCLLFFNRFIPRAWGRALVYKNQIKKKS